MNSVVPEPVLLPIQFFGVKPNVALPLSEFVPDFSTTFDALPIPNGVDALKPLVLISVSAIVSVARATYPHQGFAADIMSAPSTRVEYDTIPAPWA